MRFEEGLGVIIVTREYELSEQISSKNVTQDEKGREASRTLPESHRSTKGEVRSGDPPTLSPPYTVVRSRCDGPDRGPVERDDGL